MLKKIIIAIAVLVIIAVGAVGYFVFKPPAEASAPIQAIPLQVDQPIETGSEAEVDGVEPDAPDEAEAEVEEANNVQPEAQVEGEAEVQAEAAVESEMVEENAAPEAAAVEAEAEPAEEAAAEPVIYQIVPAESEARFLIDEVLRGDPITVVGATDQVAGQLAVDFSDPPASQVGVIQVNARTLATDNDFRNRAIKNAILVTNSYEFVTFTPTAITGLPASAAVGETYTFQIIGDLTVTDVTREVTFDVTATATDATQLAGTASTNVLYTDFDLFIPDAPAVDTVDDTVRLEIDFVAEAVSATS